MKELIKELYKDDKKFKKDILDELRKDKENSSKVLLNELKKISKDIDDLCDEYLYIKMNENCESLNASVAASILMYEINNK